MEDKTKDIEFAMTHQIVPEPTSTTKAKIIINPPPIDMRCECCGKHIDKLKPFGHAGDPLVGDFFGAKLVKTFRPDAPHLTERERRIYKKKYGKKNYEFYEQLENTVGASWECRDCIILPSDKKYFKMKHGERHEK